MTGFHSGNGSRWRTVPFGEVLVETRNGLYKPETFYGRGIPILKMFNIGRLDGTWNLASVDRVEVTPAECAIYGLELGDILLNRVNSRELVGKCAVVDHRTKGAVFESKNMRLRVDRAIADPRWAVAWLNSEFGRQQISAKLKQIVGQATVNRVDVVGIELPLPCITEQRVILKGLHEQLDRVGAARACIKEQLEAAEAFVDALLRESLSSATEAPLHECLREVTEGIGESWADYPLLGATRSGMAPAKESIGKNPQRYKPIRPGTIFYNPMRILLGSIAMIDEGESHGITSPDYVVMTCVDRKLHSRWFYFWFRSKYGAEFIKSMSRGAVRERLLFRRLATGKMRIPDWFAQQRFAQQVSEIQKLRVALRKKLEHIEAIPAALLREAFSGHF